MNNTINIFKKRFNSNENKNINKSKNVFNRIINYLLISLVCSVFCLLPSSNNLLKPVYGVDAKIIITAKSSEVCNLLYKVMDKNTKEPIPNGNSFDLIDLNSNEIVATSKTENKTGELIFENVPFGNYKIIPSERNNYYGTMYVNPNKDYVKTQHIVKDYYVTMDKNDTSIDQEDMGNGKSKFLDKNKNSDLNKANPSKTGDNTNIKSYIFMGISALSIIVAILIYSFNRKNINKKENRKEEYEKREGNKGENS